MSIPVWALGHAARRAGDAGPHHDLATSRILPVAAGDLAITSTSSGLGRLLARCLGLATSHAAGRLTIHTEGNAERWTRCIDGRSWSTVLRPSEAATTDTIDERLAPGISLELGIDDGSERSDHLVMQLHSVVVAGRRITARRLPVGVHIDIDTTTNRTSVCIRVPGGSLSYDAASLPRTSPLRSSALEDRR